MSYTKTTWVSGEQITATKLNNAENGIENLDQRVENLEGHTGAFDRQSGNLLHFQDSINAQIRDIILYGKSTQSGTPTPSAPVAINTAGDGGTLGVVSNGKNFLIIGFTSTITNGQGVTLTPLGDGSLRINGSVSSEAIACFNLRTGTVAGNTQNDRRKNLPNGTYVISGMPSGLTLQIRGTNSIQANNQGSNISVSNSTFTIDDTYAYNQVRLYMRADSSFTNVVFTPVISRVGDTTTEGYSGTIYPVTVPGTGLPGIAVSSGGNYTDSTGQHWVCDTIDLGSGVYTQRVQTVVLDGTEFWKVENTGTANWYYLCDYRAHLPEGTALQDVVLSSHYPYALVSNNNTLNGIGVGNNGGYGYVRIRYGTEDTAQNFKTWLTSNNVTVVYQKYTPVETTLTDTQLSQLRAISTLKDETYMYTDGGSGMYCEAYVNEKDLYDELEDDVASMLAKIAPEYSSSSTYNYAQLVTYNGNLYYCNTNIPTAETWTSGHWTSCSVGSMLTDRALQSISNYVGVAGISGSAENSLALGDLPVNRVLYISSGVHPSDNTKTAFTDEPLFRFFGTMLTVSQAANGTSGAMQLAMKGTSSGLDDLFYRRGVSNGWHQWIQLLTSLMLGASQYDNTATYAVGDYCIYDNKLYKCKTAIPTPAAWSSSKWTVTSIMGELNALVTRIAALEAVVLES